MTPQELKNSILQLAIQGRLVEQRQEEGTGEELFQQIQTEKQKRIKAGTIKKEKPLPEITEHEKPFDIPEGWLWTRFGSIMQLLSGQDMTPTEYNDIAKGIPYITGASNIENSAIIINRWTESPKAIAHKGDLLLTCKGTVGKTAILTEDEVHIARQIMAITPYGVETKYIMYFIDTQIKALKSQAKSMIPGIERNNVLKLTFPLPPLAEQKRIVAKIEELLLYIDRYEQAWSKLEDFNKRFPGDMQKSILQMAIQGKLVEQNPEEGNGEELYQQIQAEKQRLIKAGTIKKVKPLPEITEDEKPFDIPESWKWVALQNIAISIVDCPHSTPKYYESKTEYHTIDTTCIDANGTIIGWRYVDGPTYTSRISRLEPKESDIIYTREGSICRAAILPDSKKICLGQRVMLIRCSEGVLPQYLKQFLMAPQTVLSLTAKQRGIGAKHINVSDVCRLMIPLPPLAEQKRIVAKLEEILPLCEKLK
ncbi:restriction endonuclease subunit S [Paenibacillus sp. FSL K6-1330]|uniref:restriction endonuclease subunit S n=1 Tax=Paenibacillus sp. FSL K6-1330 TaxID=2975292 RepID=UPI0030DD7167